MTQVVDGEIFDAGVAAGCGEGPCRLDQFPGIGFGNPSDPSITLLKVNVQWMKRPLPFIASMVNRSEQHTELLVDSAVGTLMQRL